ncbi:DUF4037 domain-containing protein [Salipaludibacillus agaradhaerens]|nr:DUF4037 domain-containing protein [Salipaludibacillus agaradhaerens]
MDYTILDKKLETFCSNKDVLGIVLVGSGSRQYRDELSDYDVEVIVKDHYYNQLDEEQKFYEFEEEGIEILFYPEHDFSQKIKSCKDIEHWPYEECVILHDTNQYLEEKIIEIAFITPEDREARLKLHYFEFLFSARRVKRTLTRGNELNARLVSAQMVFVLVKLLFLLKYRWPPLLHWATENLELLEGIPEKIKLMMLEVIRRPDGFLAEKLITEVDNLLTSSGEHFHFVKTDITRQISGSNFRHIREKYGLI